MGVSRGVVIAALVALALGLLVGGLIGHFATKAQQGSSDSTAAPATASPVVDPNKPEPEKYEEHRKFTFGEASAQRLDDTVKEFSRKPHLAGSDRNNELGDMIEETWRGYGLETKKEVYNILLSYPGNETKNQAFIYDSSDSVEFESQKIEKPLVNNADPNEVVPPFNGYAKRADVKKDTAYYVNYCRIEDFDYIKNNKSIDVNGSIVICRYGKIFRGNKVKLAEENGAVGVILYNDPQENVEVPQYAAIYNDTFPNSWYLPPSGVERGSVMEFSGDPLTAGFPSKEYAFRKTVEQVRDENLIPGIPTQPVGYDDAKKFLKALGGSEVDLDSWKGKLGDGVIYRYGGPLPNSKKFRIANYNTDERRNITNVFGIIRGSVEPDRYVLMGNHRDAWMNGATDAVSGTSIMMETSRVLSELMKKTDWRPRRTIVFCSWDGEEYGIIGSIEWLDDVRVLLAERAVAYLNCDSGVVYNQVLKASASPLLHNLMYNAAKLVNHPTKEGSLYDEWKELTANKSIPDSKPLIGNLGSGSDHTGFYHRHGITSADVIYHYDKKSNNISAYYPLYHTSYDTYEAVSSFVDTSFNYHKALTQYFLEMTRNISDSVMVPFVIHDYAVRLYEVFPALDKHVRPKLLQKNETLAMALDTLKDSIDRFADKADKFDQMVKTMPGGGAKWQDVRRVNDQLFLLERSFLYPLGILDRKYIKHVLFAPSATDSYASAAFPGISDALYNIKNDDEKAWDRVKDELTKAIYTMESATKAITEDLII